MIHGWLGKEGTTKCCEEHTMKWLLGTIEWVLASVLIGCGSVLLIHGGVKAVGIFLLTLVGSGICMYLGIRIILD